ncbi:COG1470 family protein [Chryseobacterium potabilaquae]|uniref:Uncharacterized protein n=1 Tax=Chryseobacterium potabilaquae TaxID=2675057 RepID=A0A6N4XDQ3_9FLAO|nr:hypothetical protein [Chryseobacterium potabilaquae]CAA7197574.1 hypothetical protein CHRY9293_03641 [Chryseobacterium potabilaquae]
MIKIWASYFILFFPVILFSQKYTIKKDSLQPGTSTSISFTLENITSDVKIYDIFITSSSPDIFPILNKNELELAPQEKTAYIIPLRISAEAAEGIYSVTLKGIEKNKKDGFIKTSQIVISAHRKITLTSIDFPEFIKAGEIIKTSFLLKNDGNVNESLILESKNGYIEENPIQILSPGESKMIQVNKITDSNLGKNEYQNINLSVYNIDNPNEIQSVYTSTKVISIKPSEDDVYHRLPVFTSLSYIGMQDKGSFKDGFQGEIYGKGSLDKNNKSLIEFRAISKNPVEFNSFTQYEEYFINFKHDNIYFHLGDKNYSASFLTEFSRYGRGVELRYDLKKMSFGGFYNHPRFFKDIKDEFNVYSKYLLGNQSEISVGYLYKIPRLKEDSFSFTNMRLDSNAHLPYLTGKFNISKNIEISGEVSYSKTNKTNGTGYMAQTFLKFEKINGNLTYIKTSPEFSGYFSNTRTFNGNIQYRITNNINIFTNYIQDIKNFQRDTLYLAAPYRKSFQYGVQYKYLSNGSLMIYSGFQKYQDRLEPKQFDYYENFFRIAVNQQIGIFQLNIEAQFGKTENYLSLFKGTSNFYTANLGFEKFKTSFNLYASYANTSRYQMQRDKQLYYGARILSRISDKTNFSLFYQNNYIPEEYYNDRNLFEVLFHQQLFPKHSLDISGRYTLQHGQVGNKDFIFSLRYTLQLNTPTQKIAEYTSLSGNIQNLGVKKTEGIKLKLGDYLSITDKNGNYVFKNIIPGDYLLEIDRSTVEINAITNISLPTSIILTNKENIFNLGLTLAANIQGNIKLSEEGKSSTKVHSEIEKKKEKSIIIEVTNGEETYRKIAYINNPFDFTYLRPGEWKVKVYRNGLDKRYKIVMSTFQFTLTPSQTQDVTIHIVKQQNEIKYQQGDIQIKYSENKRRK